MERQQAARDVAAVIVGQAQASIVEQPDTYAHRDGRAPSVAEAGEASGGSAASDGGPVRVVPHDRLVDFELELGSGVVRFICEDGRIIGGTPVPADDEPKLESMEEEAKELRRRKPAVINVRPGKSGQPRRRTDEDPLEGLEAYGPLVWMSVGGGAMVCTLQLAEDGNCILAARMSTEDRNERLVHQLEPTLAISRRYPEILRPRMALLAVNMSGTREVRHERAGPPPPDVLERDDMLLVDAAIEAKWLEHIVWRDGDRIARDTLPGEMLLRRWQKHGVGLWLSSYGRQMDYETDWMGLTAMMMVSAAERRNSTRRMRSGAIKNGPLAGKGWLGPVPFGFVRDKHTKRLVAEQEGMRWINRTFEVADSGLCLDDAGVGLSTRDVAKTVAAEGCSFDHERVRKLLRDPIYCTGEYYVEVAKVLILQDPPENAWPVPRDRFARVQDLLALRQGRSERTPLGEFLFNYVECVHAQCEGTTNAKGHPARVKGYILKDGNPEHRRLWHGPFTPEDCKHLGEDGKTLVWERLWLEPPVVESLRHLVEHPEVQRQLAEVIRTEQGDCERGLSEDERQQLVRDVAEMLVREEALVEQQVLGTLELDEWKRLFRGLHRRREAAEARLQRDDDMKAAAAEEQQTGQVVDRGVPDRAQLFLDILTVETPTDPRLKALRARLFQRCVSRVIIDDSGTGDIVVTVEGVLVPPGADMHDCNPVLACADLLVAYDRSKDGESDVAPLPLETAHEARAAKAVSRHDVDVHHLLSLPSGRALERQRAAHLDARSWRQRRDSVTVGRVGTVGWRTHLHVARAATPRQSRRARRLTVVDLLRSGVLRPNERLVGVCRGRTFYAHPTPEGVLAVDGLGDAMSLGAAAQLCGASPKSNGWSFWHVERGEACVAMSSLRSTAVAADLSDAQS